VAERSKARVWSRSFVGVAGSNPDGRMDVCVACCKERQKKRSKMQDGHNKEQVWMKYKASTREYKKKIPLGNFSVMSVVCCTGRVLCEKPITHSEGFY
jgi:hypothetical protein